MLCLCLLVKCKYKTISLFGWIGALEIDQWHEGFCFSMFSFLCFLDKRVYKRSKFNKIDVLPHCKVTFLNGPMKWALMLNLLPFEVSGHVV